MSVSAPASSPATKPVVADTLVTIYWSGKHKQQKLHLKENRTEQENQLLSLYQQLVSFSQSFIREYKAGDNPLEDSLITLATSCMEKIGPVQQKIEELTNQSSLSSVRAGKPVKRERTRHRTQNPYSLPAQPSSRPFSTTADHPSSLLTPFKDLSLGNSSQEERKYTKTT